MRLTTPLVLFVLLLCVLAPPLHAAPATEAQIQGASVRVRASGQECGLVRCMQVTQAGSGTLIGRSDESHYLVATCNHIGDRLKRDTIRVAVDVGGKTYTASVLANDPQADICLLDFQATESYPTVDLSTTVPPAGSRLRAYGYPNAGPLQGRDGVMQQLADDLIYNTASQQGDSGGGVFYNGEFAGVHWGGNGVSGHAAPVEKVRLLMGRRGIRCNPSSPSGTGSQPAIPSTPYGANRPESPAGPASPATPGPAEPQQISAELKAAIAFFKSKIEEIEKTQGAKPIADKIDSLVANHGDLLARIKSAEQKLADLKSGVDAVAADKTVPDKLSDIVKIVDGLASDGDLKSLEEKLVGQIKSGDQGPAFEKLSGIVEKLAGATQGVGEKTESLAPVITKVAADMPAISAALGTVSTGLWVVAPGAAAVLCAVSIGMQLFAGRKTPALTGLSAVANPPIIIHSGQPAQPQAQQNQQSAATVAAPSSPVTAAAPAVASKPDLVIQTQVQPIDSNRHAQAYAFAARELIQKQPGSEGNIRTMDELIKQYLNANPAPNPA